GHDRRPGRGAPRAARLRGPAPGHRPDADDPPAGGRDAPDAGGGPAQPLAPAPAGRRPHAGRRAGQLRERTPSGRLASHITAPAFAISPTPAPWNGCANTVMIQTRTTSATSRTAAVSSTARGRRTSLAATGVAVLTAPKTTAHATYATGSYV